MVRHLATIRTITRITPIPKASRIECAHIDGWPVVIGKDSLKVGDKVVYYEPDSMLPLNNPAFAGLAARGKNVKNDTGILCVVLKTVKLRGQISQGLVTKLSEVGIPAGTPAGTDVSDQLGISKYDPPEIANAGIILKPFPSNISMTDEPRIQNMAGFITWLQEHPEAANHYRASEKIDGTSATFYREETDGEVKYGICSHGAEIMPASKENLYFNVYKTYDIRQRLDNIAKPGMRTIAIQGEIAGPGIHSNRLALAEPRFFAFNVIIDNQRHNPADFNELKDIIVPQLDLTLPLTMDEIIALSYGRKSVVSPNRLSEGVVWRIDEDASKYDVPDDWRHFKSINNKYLLKE